MNLEREKMFLYILAKSKMVIDSISTKNKLRMYEKSILRLDDIAFLNSLLQNMYIVVKLRPQLLNVSTLAGEFRHIVRCFVR